MFSIHHRKAGARAGTTSGRAGLVLDGPAAHRMHAPGFLKVLFLSLAPTLLWACPVGAEESRYGHGDAEVRTSSLPQGCVGRGCVLIDKAERWVAKLPWIVQDEMLEPTSITLPAPLLNDGRDSCLVYWDVYVPVGAQAVWHVRYAGEMRRQNGAWRIRYYSTATLRALTV